MNFRNFFILFFVFLSTLVTSQASFHAPIAKATISQRVSKPGQRLELLITVRSAEKPALPHPECPSGLLLIKYWKPQHLRDQDGDLWLMKYRLLAKSVGDYEISPVQISLGNSTVFTKPVILHVTNDAKPPLPDARELALTTDIPIGLAQEAVKNCPLPPSKPVPTPVPGDFRPLPSRVFSSIRHGLIWFWNYPGK